MNVLSDRVNNLSESETIALARRSRELRAQGVDVIDLSLGDLDFNTPDHIKQAGINAINDNNSFYTPVAGYPELRKAISDKFKRENNLDYSIDEIVVSNGGKHSIANILMCLINPGDEVIAPTPYWVTYPELIKLAGGVTVKVDAGIESNFKVTPNEIEKLITPKTKLFMFSSPCNPTGSVYTKEELKKLAEMFARHPHVFILADEIYEHVIYGTEHFSIASFDFIKDQVITINGVSKCFAMTGWRIGYIGAPKYIAKACEKLQGQFTSCTCAVSQKAAMAAINSDLAPTHEMVKVFMDRRDTIVKLLKEIPGIETNIPEGAFYVFPKVSFYFGTSDGKTTINNAVELCDYLLNNAHVAIVAGNAFGSPEYIRISYALPIEKIKEAIERLSNCLSKLKKFYK